MNQIHIQFLIKLLNDYNTDKDNNVKEYSVIKNRIENKDKDGNIKQYNFIRFKYLARNKQTNDIYAYDIILVTTATFIESLISIHVDINGNKIRGKTQDIQL